MTDSEKSRIMLISATENDFKAIDNLCEMRFGKGYLSKEKYIEWLAFPELFLVALYDGVFAGFAFLMPEENSKLADFLKINEEDLEQFSGGKPVIHCLSAALVPEFEHHGIMYELLSNELKEAKKLGFGAAFAPAWKYNDKIPMGKLMDLLGFKKLYDRQRLWYNQKGYKCVVCGGRCRCDAAVFYKEL